MTDYTFIKQSCAECGDDAGEIPERIAAGDIRVLCTECAPDFDPHHDHGGDQ